MTTAVTENRPMSDPKIVAYQVRCSREWIDRVEFAANKLGLSAAGFIRMAITQRLDNDGVPAHPPKQKRLPKKPTSE